MAEREAKTCEEQLCYRIPTWGSPSSDSPVVFVKGEDRGIICKCKAGVSVSQCVRRLGFHSMSGRTAASTCEADHHRSR